MTEDSPSPKTVPTNWRRVSQRVGIYLAIWLVVLTALVAQTAWGVNLSWPQAIVRVVRDWVPWVILGPCLWWLVKRFPLFGEKRLRHLGMHFLASIVMAMLAETLVALVLYPATQPVLERASLSDRDLRREIRGVRPRPVIRKDAYSFRPRMFVRKAQIWFLLNWVFVLIGTAVLQRRSAEERARRALTLQNDLAEARLRELQSRLHPHFLFNALNSIAALIPMDPEKAEDMVSRLSMLLRRALASSEKPLIRLSEELSLLRDYLAIEQVRFPDRLSIEESIDEAALACLVPPLTLQPIAENAVKHGIEPKSDPSRLQIIARMVEAGFLELQIVDDGIGDAAAKERSTGLGIGLQNVRERLETAFPGTSNLSVEHPDEGGTTVTIQLPTTNERNA